ncbi:aldolase [Ensifer sp.]|uniref:aldolase n=1 Tax=Ensifer sp. TaxID=1872086 RepID=UPI00289EA732|nr:aldolase [Ensifer sp.]
MSVNRFKTKKPLLSLRPGALLPTSVGFGAFGGIVVDFGSNNAALTALVTATRGACRVFARIASIDRVTEGDLAQLLDRHIDGVMLGECRGRVDVQRLDVMLRVAEASAGIRRQHIAILAEYGTTPESVLSPHSLDECSLRLEGLVFDGNALATALGCASPNTRLDVTQPASIVAGRAAAILRAREASLDCYETLPQAALTENAVRIAMAASRANGFSSVVCHMPQQAAWLDADD